jgi:hypothetical protein
MQIQLGSTLVQLSNFEVEHGMNFLNNCILLNVGELFNRSGQVQFNQRRPVE